MKKQLTIWLFVAAIVLVPSGVYAVVKWYEHRFTALPVLGGENHRIDTFQFINQNNELVSRESWDRKIVVANLFFSHCPVVCPKMLRNMKNVQQLYLGDKELLLTSFSVDPERDSATKLKSFAERMDITGNWHLLTGNKRELYRFARKSLLVVATDGDGGPGDFIHSELLVLIDPSKRVRGYYNGTEPAEVENLIKDIARLKREVR